MWSAFKHMDSSASRLLLLFLSAVFITQSVSVQVCRPARCNDRGFGPAIRFPFRLVGLHDPSCGYPGFDVTCNSQGLPVITLPSSGEFVVNWISYTTQSIYINDPGTCLPNRISSFSANDSAFRAGPADLFRFFNCSIGWEEFSEMQTHAVPIICNPVRQQNMSLILALPVGYPVREIPTSRCTLMPNVSIPLKLTFTKYLDETVVVEDLELTWTEPNCQKCENLDCGFKNKKGLEIGCGLPKKSKKPGEQNMYGIIVGVGILVFLVGILGYNTGKFHRLSHHNSDSHLTTTSSASTPPPSITVSGFDGAPTIELHTSPARATDGTCPICLSEYELQQNGALATFVLGHYLNHVVISDYCNITI